jgi:hypothetical protein
MFFSKNNDVRFESKGDIGLRPNHVCSTPQQRTSPDRLAKSEKCQYRKSLYSITLSARVVGKVRVDMLGRLPAPAGKCRGQGRVASTDVGLAGQPLSYQQRFRWLDATTQISQHRNIRPSQIP